MRKNKIWAGIFLIILIAVIGLNTNHNLFGDGFKISKESKQVQPVKYQELNTGDIIFQTSESNLSRAIELATHSEFSHCGIIFKKGEDCYVLEAVQPIKRTPLEKWIARGKRGHYVIKRLKNSDAVLTPEITEKMLKIGNSFEGKNYDIYFGWSDDLIYCSELVWKIYQRAVGIEIGKLDKLRNFDLTNEIVKYELHERYGNNIPLDELVISPEDIFDSELLTTIKTN
jgi:hypothetical protein